MENCLEKNLPEIPNGYGQVKGIEKRHPKPNRKERKRKARKLRESGTRRRQGYGGCQSFASLGSQMENCHSFAPLESKWKKPRKTTPWTPMKNPNSKVQVLTIIRVPNSEKRHPKPNRKARKRKARKLRESGTRRRQGYGGCLKSKDYN